MKHVVSHVPDKVDASAVVNPVLTNKTVVVAQQIIELPIQTQIIIWGLFMICGFYLIMEAIHLYEEVVNYFFNPIKEVKVLGDRGEVPYKIETGTQNTVGGIINL